MIKITVNNMIKSIDTFNKILQQSFKGSLAFQIARIVRELDKEMQTFNNEKTKLIQKYAEKDEKGNLIVDENDNVKIDNSKIEEVNKEFESLLQTEIEINAEKLSINNIDNFELTPQEMLNIEVFFEE